MAQIAMRIQPLRRIAGLVLLGLGAVIVAVRGLDAVTAGRANESYRLARDASSNVGRDLALGAGALAAGAGLIVSAHRRRP